MSTIQPVKQAVITLEALTPPQQRVAAALLQGATISEAAKAAEVNRRTVHRWCRDNPAFRAALAASQRMHAQYISDQIRDLVGESVAALRKVINDGWSESATVRAAMSVLDRASRFGHNQAEPVEYLRAKIDAIVASIPETEFVRTRDILRQSETLSRTAKR